LKLSRKYSDEKLIKGCKQNSRVHQEQLYRRYFPDCYYMCLRYTNDEDTARLIVNDGFFKVFKNIKQFAGSGSLKGWIKRIVFNAMSDYYRKESKHLKMMLLEDDVKVTEASSEASLYYDDIISLVDELSENTRKVFKLYAIDGYNHKEIGNLLNISEGNSKWHLHKARKILQEKITLLSKYHRHA